jgi:putative transposase
MHLTLKEEATKSAATNFLQQQARFDKFIEVFNHEHLYEARDMKCFAEVSSFLPAPIPVPDIDCPFHDKTIVVTRCGRICLDNKKTNFSQVFAGQPVGIKEVHDDVWLVSFMDYDLGYFDLETRVLERSKIRSTQKCHPCDRCIVQLMSPGRTIASYRQLTLYGFVASRM